MSILQAIFLGFIQGITEFLPVSSSGHLVLFQQIFGIEEPAMAFDVYLHIGTLIPVFIVFWQDIWALIRKPFQKLTYMLIIGTLPTVIFALLFSDLIEDLFQGGFYLGFNFIITGFILLYAGTRKNGRKKLRESNYLDAGIVGVFQALAIMPAISRSGMTISGALSRGLDRNFAAKFSFLLSIPAILGAMVLELKKMVTATEAVESVPLVPTIAGVATAALVGYVAVRFMLAIIRRGKLQYFSYYVFLLGAFVILDQFALHFIF